MKKTILFLIAFLILLPITFGQEITLYDSIYVSGETVQAKVEYDSFDIAKLSVVDSENNKITVAFFPLEIGENKNFVYFNLPISLEAGTYLLQLQDRRLIEGEWTGIFAEKSLEVIEGANAFTIKPAAIRLDSEKDSFKIELKHAKGSSMDIAISVSNDAIEPVRNSISLSPGTSKFLFSGYDSGKLETDAEIILDFENRSYKILLIIEETVAVEGNITEENITAENNVTEPEPDEEPGTRIGSAIGMVSKIKEITDIVNQETTIEGPIKFVNTYHTALHNVVFNVNPELQGLVGFDVTTFEIVEPNQTYTEYIWVNKEKDVEPGQYSGEITITSDEGATYSIKLEFIFEEAKEEQETKVNITDYVPLNISINYSEIQEETEEDRAKNLKIAIMLISGVLLLIALIAFRLRPKKKDFSKVGDYAGHLKKPVKKK